MNSIGFPSDGDRDESDKPSKREEEASWPVKKKKRNRLFGSPNEINYSNRWRDRATHSVLHRYNYTRCAPRLLAGTPMRLG